MASSVTRESNVSWDILAEMSKQETTSVYTMVLKRFAELDAGTVPDGTQSASSATHYLSYPPDDISSLMKEYKVGHWLKEYDLAWGDGLLPQTDTNDSKKQKKKSSKHKHKSNQLSAADRIRQTQVRTLATETYVQHFGKLKRTRLDPDFHSRVAESIVLYYAYVTHYSLKDTIVETFIDAAFSLRDALKVFSEAIHPEVLSLMKQFCAALQSKFPWPTFLKYYTHLLIRTHFKRKFKGAVKPFPEQEQLLQEIHADPFNLYVLPWGVGTGKTAMLPPLSMLYADVGYQTLYCVPFGPVRDQSAALLLRCGVPFAYIVEAPNALGTQWELQPSFHCSDGRLPEVFIVDPRFVQAYTEYWDKNTAMDTMGHPPDIYIPSRKKRYAHLSHQIWNPQWILMLDEPSEEDEAVKWVLHHLPPTAFVMSATSWQLVNSDVKEHHKQRTGKACVTIPARTVGVSTTLIGYWMESEAVLSPFHGIESKQAFAKRLQYIRDKILWRRFLSAEVLLDWVVRMRRMKPSLSLPFTFDLFAITFDSISERVLEFADTMVQSDLLTDEDFREFFRFGNDKQPRTSGETLKHFITNESGKFMGGCIIGTPTVEETYEQMAPLLDDCPSIDDIQQTLDDHRKQHVAKYLTLEKIPVSKPEDRIRKQDKFRELDHQRWTTLPIPETLVLNTPEYLQRFKQPRFKNTKTLSYLRVHDLVETGDPSKGVDGWYLTPDTMQGVTFARDQEAKLQWRWKGVGSIIDHKEFNMKNIRDLDNHTVGFLLLDTLGAQGLNLKIRHGILMKGQDGSMLPTSTCLQVAGRVGRWGQDSTGYVYLMHKDMFHHMFA